MYNASVVDMNAVVVHGYVCLTVVLDDTTLTFMTTFNIHHNSQMNLYPLFVDGTLYKILEKKYAREKEIHKTAPDRKEVRT
jgi:hypothetical protein